MWRWSLWTERATDPGQQPSLASGPSRPSRPRPLWSRVAASWNTFEPSRGPPRGVPWRPPLRSGVRPARPRISAAGLGWPCVRSGAGYEWPGSGVGGRVLDVRRTLGEPYWHQPTHTAAPHAVVGLDETREVLPGRRRQRAGRVRRVLGGHPPSMPPQTDPPCRCSAAPSPPVRLPGRPSPTPPRMRRRLPGAVGRTRSAPRRPGGPPRQSTRRLTAGCTPGTSSCSSTRQRWCPVRGV